MNQTQSFSADRMAEVFLAYLFKNRANDRHIRRIGSWLGLLILGTEKVKTTWWVSHTRQLFFESGGKRYKARFQHRIRPRGGIEFVEVAKKPGNPEIRIARQIADLADAAAFYRRPSL